MTTRNVKVCVDCHEQDDNLEGFEKLKAIPLFSFLHLSHTHSYKMDPGVQIVKKYARCTCERPG